MPDPFHCTCDPGTKPLPYTVNGNADEPAGIEPGLKLATKAAAGLIVKVAVLDAPPFWFTNRMLAVPAVEIRLAGTAAVTVVSDGCDVFSGAPFHCTTHPAGQFAPLTVKVKAGEPAIADVGAMVPIDGAATMGNGCASERPAPVESITCNEAVPAIRSEVAGIAA